MPFTEDLSPFFAIADFAVAAVLHLSESEDRTINVIFNDPTQALQLFDSSVDAGATFLLCKQTDIADVRDGMTVTVNSRTYKIERRTRDETGTGALYLKK